jgi:predicted transcriptional regulator of viral defense system
MLAAMNMQPIDITIAGSDADPRDDHAPDGIRIHRVPSLHPDDVTVVDGIPVTTVARTLVDLADVMPRSELRATFRAARRRGLLDIAAVRASAARVEWRPSLEMLHEVIDEFDR